MTGVSLSVLRVLTSLAATMVAGTLVGLAPGTASASTCVAWTGTQPPDPGGPASLNSLSDAATLSPCNAWAVGSYTTPTVLQNPMVVHWNGHAWTQVSAPNPSGGSGSGAVLSGVAALSATDAWAVGSYVTTDLAGLSYILHWNGHAWTQVPNPNPGGGGESTNVLNGVTAVSARNAWTVGHYVNPNLQGDQTLIEHWNGRSWRQVPSPNVTRYQIFNQLDDVAAASASDIWAVGRSAGNGILHTLIEHWDGFVWKRVPSPDPDTKSNYLSGVAVLSGRDAWAVGTVGEFSALILHWNGRAWKPVRVPPLTNSLSAVVAISSRDAWAVGAGVILHWNGRSWRTVPEPVIGSSSAKPLLSDVSASSASNIWAVGAYNDGQAFQTAAVHCC